MFGKNPPSMPSLDLIISNDPHSPILEAFKMIRTNIEFSAIDKTIRVLNVTSAGQGEGKSTVLVNLSIAFAMIGRRVLLIDADLRRPYIHRLLGLSNRRGVTNALLSHEDYHDYVQPTKFDNLSVLTAGPIPPNPAELLMSDSMGRLIEATQQDYDMVFIDCPPVGVITDAAIISRKVDGTIFVVRSGVTDKRLLKKAIDHLNQVNAHVLGFVYNGVAQNSDDYYYQNQYYAEGLAVKHPKSKKRVKNVTGVRPVKSGSVTSQKND